MENLYLIAGLGNPGAQYVRTRHNVGFMAVERLAGRRKWAWNHEEKFTARVARGEFDGRKLLLVEPQTYMNSSGLAVRAVSAYFKAGLEALLVVVDDADLPLGEIRLRSGGSSGGHHGLESIEEQLGTRDYARLRIGIGRQASGARAITDYVLGQFGENEIELLQAVLDRVVSQMECWVTAGIGRAMSQFNGAIKPPMPKES